MQLRWNLPEGSVPAAPSKVLLVIWKRASRGVPLALVPEAVFDADEDAEEGNPAAAAAADEQDFLAFFWRPEDEWQEEEEDGGGCGWTSDPELSSDFCRLPDSRSKLGLAEALPAVEKSSPSPSVSWTSLDPLKGDAEEALRLPEDGDSRLAEENPTLTLIPTLPARWNGWKLKACGCKP